MKKYTGIIAVFTLAAFAAGCSPEVGSDKWCANMKDKDKDDWTQSETKDYAKNCLFK